MESAVSVEVYGDKQHTATPPMASWKRKSISMTSLEGALPGERRSEASFVIGFGAARAVQQFSSGSVTYHTGSVTTLLQW